MIDDERSNLQIVKIILASEHFPCELTLFEDGARALEAIAITPPELILLDLSMPGMDGFEVMNRLKNDPATAGIPVIFLSAYHDTEHILKAFQLGATDFIGKPIISPLLIARIHNVLQTRLLQTQIIRSNKELTQTNQLKDDLLSICSHDLRGPLSSIDLLCQFMNDTLAGDSDAAPEELVRRIASQSRMARRLVENLLDMSKIEEGRLLPQPSFFMLDELILAATEGEGPLLEARELRLDLAGTGENLLCHGDREMLSQVMHNVLSNASKHARSRVSLECRLLDFSEELGGKVSIVVGDDGPGIPLESRDQVFEKFSKVEPLGGGSGLGLYISRQMIELHKGSIAITQGDPGHTAVEVIIPHAFKPGQLPDLQPHIHRRALVLSESKVVREMLTALLNEAGMIDVIPVPNPGTLHANTSLLETDSGAPPIGVMDVDNCRMVPGQIGEASGTSSPGIAIKDLPWLLYGSEEAIGIMAKRMNHLHHVVGSSHNPLVFLRAFQSLLEGEGNSKAQLSV